MELRLCSMTHSSQKSTYSDSIAHKGTRGKHTRGHHPFRYLRQIHTQDLTPLAAHHTSLSLVLSASLHVVGKMLCLPTFWRFLQEAWLNVSTNAKFGWGPEIISTCGLHQNFSCNFFLILSRLFTNELHAILNPNTPYLYPFSLVFRVIRLSWPL